MSVASLKARARLLKQIRDFFEVRGVLEVDTPLLYPYTIPDLNIPSLSVAYQGKTAHLQTSPEFCMKRLLAEGSGSIFQVCKAFRDDFCGRYHSSEFTMLEWYRVDFDHHNLMNEVDELLQITLKTAPAKKVTYQQLFLTTVNIDPLSASVDELKKVLSDQDIVVSDEILNEVDKDVWLNLMMSHLIEPKLAFDAPLMLYDYPASQAALARISEKDARVAERFEVFYRGIELANGFHELNDGKLQRTRFEKYNNEREEKGLSVLPMDEAFLSAVNVLPDCAGVALGVDRLLMLLCDASCLQDVL